MNRFYKSALCFILLFNTVKPLVAQKTEINSFDFLEKQVLQEKRTPIKQKLVLALIQKAKTDNDLRNLYRSYFLGYETLGDETHVKYADSMVRIATQLKDNDKIGEAFLASGIAHSLREDYKNAISNTLIGLDYYKINDNPYNINSAKLSLANINTSVNQISEAYKLFAETVSFYRNNQNKIGNEDNRQNFLHALIGLIDINTKLGNFAENKTLIKEGKIFVQNPKNKEFLNYYPYFISSEGTDYYYQKDYDGAIRKLDEALSSYKDQWKHLTEKFYLGMSYWHLGNNEKALHYLEMIDKDYDETGKLYPEFRPTYETLISFYKKKGDKEKQLFYIEKLLKIDKENAEMATSGKSTFIKEFDTKKLLEEKDQLNRNQNFLYFLGGIALVLLASIFYYIRIRKKKTQTSFVDRETLSLITKNETQNNTIDYEKYKPIHRSTVDFILKQMDEFERKKRFLRRNLKLSSLAIEFNTNERYLSTIIKIKHDKNFNEYINQLRLNYFIEESEKNEVYRKQSIKSIAEQLGFTTHEMFSKEFKNFARLSPKEFLEKLKGSE